MPKGRKTCKSCGKECGLRSQTCEGCGTAFGTGGGKKAAEEVPVAINRNDLIRLYTPGTGAGGKMSIPLIPVKPDGLTNIPEWIEKCQVAGEKYGVTYTVHAMKYMARQIWHDKPDELKQALALIVESFDNNYVEPVVECTVPPPVVEATSKPTFEWD